MARAAKDLKQGNVTKTNATESSTIQVDDKRRLITVLMEGPATDTGLMALLDRLRTLPEFIDGYNVLFDASNIGEVHVTGNGVFNLAQASQNDENRMATVVEFAHPAWPHFAHLNWPHLMLIFWLDRGFKSSGCPASLRNG